MRPVNLLPAGQRVRGKAERKGSASLVLAALGILLVGTLVYVLMGNVATSRKNEANRVQQEAAAAETRAASLKAFGAFAELKQTRETSVRQLVSGRFDWERSMRDLARVLPAGVWLSSLDGSLTGDTASAGSSGTAAGGTGASSSQASGPSLKLSGCAPSQSAVAATLVRLRALRSAAEVTLSDSSKGDSGSTAGSGASPPAAGAGAGSCDRYTFNATVRLGAPSGVDGGGTGAPAPAPAGSGR